MSEDAHDRPPHMGEHPENPGSPPSEAFDPHPAAPPPAKIDPNLQHAITALIQAMTTQFRLGMRAAQAPPPGARPAPAAANRAYIKTWGPDPYDGSDPSKLRAFLSQRKLVFRSHPDDFREDTVKITYATSWLRVTAQRWYEPTLELEYRIRPS